MKTNKLYLIAALMGTVLAGCQREQFVQEPEEQQTPVQKWTLTVEASKEANTRAMEMNGTKPSPYWAKDEIVDVFCDGIKIGTLAVISEDKANPTTLKGEVTVAEGADLTGKTLTLLFPGREEEDAEPWTYLGQDGKVPAGEEAGDMASKYDYAKASLGVTSMDASTMTIVTSTSSVHFDNQQSIYRVRFVSGASDILAKHIILTSNQSSLARSFSYRSGEWAATYGSLSMTPTQSANPYWMAIRNDNVSTEDLYTFSVVGSDDALYFGSKAIPVAVGGTNVLGNGHTVGATIPIARTNGLFTSISSITISTPADVL